MKKFSYSSDQNFLILIQQMIGVMGLSFSSGIASLLFLATRNIEISQPVNFINDPRATLICIGLWVLIIGVITSFGLINAYPTIWIDHVGITISAFIFVRIQIPWSEIVDLRVGIVRFGHDLVIVRRISIFHRIYGLMYTGTIHPSFIIRKDIPEHETLISEVRQRVH